MRLRRLDRVDFFIFLALLMGVLLMAQGERGGRIIIVVGLCWWALLFMFFVAG